MTSVISQFYKVSIDPTISLGEHETPFRCEFRRPFPGHKSKSRTGAQKPPPFQKKFLSFGEWVTHGRHGHRLVDAVFGKRLDNPQVYATPEDFPAVPNCCLDEVHSPKG